jgi:hypothetical protein
MGNREPWWRPYLLPMLVSLGVTFGGWSVAQHALIRSHDQAQEIRLAGLETAMAAVQRHIQTQEMLGERLAKIEAQQSLTLLEVSRIRDQLQRLEARR